MLQRHDDGIQIRHIFIQLSFTIIPIQLDFLHRTTGLTFKVSVSSAGPSSIPHSSWLILGNVIIHRPFNIVDPHEYVAALLFPHCALLTFRDGAILTCHIDATMLNWCSSAVQRDPITNQPHVGRSGLFIRSWSWPQMCNQARSLIVWF